MIDRIRGEVTARISFLHSFTKYAVPTRIQFPIVQSRLMITPEKVLCSMLNHSTSAETLAQVYKKKFYKFFFINCKFLKEKQNMPVNMNQAIMSQS